MQSLASLLSATTSPAASAAKGEPADAPVSYEHDDSQFDELMSQAMAAPAEPKTNHAGANGNLPGPTSLPSHQAAYAAAPGTAVDASSLLNIVPDAAVKSSPKDSTKKASDPADTNSATTAGNASPDAIQLMNSAQDLPIQLLAAVLPSHLPAPAKSSGGTGGASGTNGLTDDANAGGNLMTSATAKSATMATDLSAKLSNSKPGGTETGTGPVNAKSLAAAKLSLAPNPVGSPVESPVAKTETVVPPTDGNLSRPAIPSGAATESAMSMAPHLTTAKDSTIFPGKRANIMANPLTGATVAAASVSASSAKTAGADLPPGPADTASDTQETLANASSEVNLASHAFPPMHGTLAAKQDVPMKNAENTIKVAGPSEKDLPGDVLSSARVSSLPDRGVSAAAATPRDSSLGNNIIPFSPASERGAESTATTGSVAVSSLDDIRMRALDRTQDMVALHAVRLVESNADSLSVVIKPGAGMQLSLQLTQNADGISAQAVLQHGDFENLNRHWPELQDRLEQRGIKLAPLASDESAMSFANQNRGQQNRQQPPEEKALFASAFAEFSMAGVSGVTGASAQPALASLATGGWQSWA